MKKMLRAGVSIAVLAGAGLVGCEIGSPDTVIREVGIVIAGFYANSGGNLVSENSGAPIETLNLIQNGDDLQGVDNNGKVFRGTVMTVAGTAASIQLTGRTTSGAEGTIQATIDSAGGTATMRGTWIEASLFGTVYGTATVPTNGSGGSIAISGAGTVTNNSATTYTASGGSGTYTWTVSSSSLGTIAGSGSTAVYAANSTDGTQTITASSGGRSGSKTVTQQ